MKPGVAGLMHPIFFEQDAHYFGNVLYSDKKEKNKRGNVPETRLMSPESHNLLVEQGEWLYLLISM